MATYYVWSGATGAANGTSFTDAYTSLSALFTAEAIAGNDIIKIASDHDNSSYAANLVLNFPETSQSTALPVYLISSNRGTGNPEVGAIEQTGDNYGIFLRYRVYCYGITFKTGNGTSQTSADITFGMSSAVWRQVYDSCTFQINSTSTTALIIIDCSPGEFYFTNCTFTFGATGQYISCDSGHVEFTQCTLGGATFPTSLFEYTGNSNIFISGCDFSSSTNLTANPSTVCARIYANNSILPSNITPAATNYIGGTYHEIHACGSTAHNYFYSKRVANGDVDHDVSVYMTTGSATMVDTDGSSVPYSLKMTSNANNYSCNKYAPLYSPWLYVPVFTTGSKTFSLEIAHTEAGNLTDMEAWMEVEYMGGSATINTPQSQREITAPVLSGTISLDIQNAGSSMTDTANAWTGIASEKTHVLSKTVTVDEQGYARVRVALAVNNISIYVNPDVSVT